MSYSKRLPSRTLVKSVEVVEGETIEQKVSRITEEGDPIKDGAPEIFTDRRDGVLAAYNIRTDRFEIAAEAMDAVNKSKIASRDAKMDVVKDDKIDGLTDGNGQQTEGGA